jgi:hypothetical protein
MTLPPATSGERALASKEAFARKLIEGCDTHDAWLSVVRFGLATLLDDQPLLIELIFREATKMVDWSKAGAGFIPVKEVQRIFEELGLKLDST